jgi:hypothetical protein
MWQDRQDLTAPSDRLRLVRPENPEDRMAHKDLSGQYRRQHPLRPADLLVHPVL